MSDFKHLVHRQQKLKSQNRTGFSLKSLKTPNEAFINDLCNNGLIGKISGYTSKQLQDNADAAQSARSRQEEIDENEDLIDCWDPV